MGMMMWWLHEVKLDDLLYQFLTLIKIIKIISFITSTPIFFIIANFNIV
jgi:hypothetical protein